MNSKYLIKVSLLLLIIFLLGSLTACTSTQLSTVKDATLNSLTPTLIPSPAKIVTAVSVNNDSTTYTSASVASFPLEVEEQRVDYIFQAKVVAIGQLVWNSSDGKEPVDEKLVPRPQQLAPVDLSMIEQYKGSLSKTNLTVLIPGAPGSKPYGQWKGFPQLGDTIIWFARGEKDFRLSSAPTSNPLISLVIDQMYTLKSDSTWVSLIDGNTLTIDRLINAIKNPVPIPTRQPTLPPPTLDPQLQPGQTINLVKYFSLSNEGIIGAKTSKFYGGIEPKKAQAALATLDRPLTIAENPYKKREVQDPYKVVQLTILGQVKGVPTYLDFELNLTDNYLVMVQPFPLQVQIPAEFAQILGIN
jgi:hypothetical protein